MKVAVRVLGAAVAAAIGAVLVARIGVHAILEQLTRVGPGFAWILVLHLAAMVSAAFAWTVLLPRAARPSPAGSIVSRFFASGANASLPLFGLGGELVRLLWLRPPDRPMGLAAVVVDRLAYGVASVILLGAGVLGVLHAPSLPASYARTTGIVAAALVVGIVLLVVIAPRAGLAARLQRLLRREPAFGESVDTHLTSMLTVRNPNAWRSVLLHLLFRALIGAEIVVGFYLLDVPLPWDQALVFAALPIVLSVVGAVVPSQLGVHEGAQALVAASFGIAAPTAVAVVLLLRLRQLVGVALVGPYLLATKRRLAPV